MKAYIALLLFSGLLAVSQASALKLRRFQELQYSCDLKKIETLYENIWAQTYFFRNDVLATVQEAVDDVVNCKQVLPHIEKFVSCVKEAVRTGVSDVGDEVRNYTNSTRELCDQLTGELRICFTL